MKKTYPGITGLRGVAAFIIAYIFHYQLLFSVMPVHTPALEKLFQAFGYLFVNASDVFFFLSGFLMYESYHQRIQKSGMSLRKFLFPKMKKIYPLMIVMALWMWLTERIGLALLGAYPLHGDGGKVRYSFFSLLLNMAGLQTGWISDGDVHAVNGPSWFVSVILICYVLFYLILRYAKSRKTELVLFGILTAGGMLFTVFPVELPLLYSCVARGYFGFFGGALIWYITKEWSPAKKEASSIVILAVLTAVLVWLLLPAPEERRVNYPALCIVWGCCSYLAIYGKVCSAVFSLPPLQWLGKRSMSVFLCNLPTDALLSLLNQVFGWQLDYSRTEIWMIHVVVSLLIVEISYLLFEKGGIRLKRRGGNAAPKQQR